MKCSSLRTNHQSSSQTKTQLQTYHKVRSSLVAWLDKVFAFLFAGSDEIQIRQRTDRYGQIWWYVYDPGTRRASVFDSESDVRAWIERRSHI